MKCFRIRVFGDVHGVGFRYAALRKAQELHLVGFVRNAADGSVCIEAQGNESELQRFIAWCAKGPPYARVERVMQEQTAVGNYDDFHID